MMKHLGIVNDRKIYFLSMEQERWASSITLRNWLALINCDEKNLERMKDVIQNCLAFNVEYICTIGKECEWLHDCFDDEINWQNIQGTLPERLPMTTWHNDFEEGIWFALHAAYPEDGEIESIVFIDATCLYAEADLHSILVKIELRD